MAMGTLFSTRDALKVFCTLPPDKRTEKPIYKQAAIRDNPIILLPRFMP